MANQSSNLLSISAASAVASNQTVGDVAQTLTGSLFKQEGTLKYHRSPERIMGSDALGTADCYHQMLIFQNSIWLQ